jgi:CDP-diacylglycerol--glycerol-3-phosphate 3-phosphatidyltransferase
MGKAAPPEEAIPRIPLLIGSVNEDILSPLDRRSEAYRHQAKEIAEKNPAPRGERQPILTISNQLTFLRLVLVPVLLLMWEWEWKWSPTACAVVFITASITDWLDGYLARKVGGGCVPPAWRRGGPLK